MSTKSHYFGNLLNFLVASNVTNSTGWIQIQICVLKRFDLQKYELEYIHCTGQNCSVHKYVSSLALSNFFNFFFYTFDRYNPPKFQMSLAERPRPQKIARLVGTMDPFLKHIKATYLVELW